MSINVIEREVLKLIGENTDDPDVFVDTTAGMEPIRSSVSDAIFELSMVTGAYRKTYYLPLEEDTFLYNMTWQTDYFGYVLQAWDRQTHQRLDQTDPQALAQIDPAWMGTTGDPTHYYHVGYQTIGIYRTPSTGGKVIELDCVCIPKEYTEGTDLIKVRNNHQRACVYFAVSEFYASRGDARRANEWHQQYLETARIAKLKPKTFDWRTMGATRELS